LKLHSLFLKLEAIQKLEDFKKPESIQKKSNLTANKIYTQLNHILNDFNNMKKSEDIQPSYLFKDFENEILEETTKTELQFEKRGGLLPVAVQETQTGQLLMMASVNQEAFEISLNTKKATFWSTSKNAIWTTRTNLRKYFID
jgi:hypothetical protein